MQQGRVLSAIFTAVPAVVTMVLGHNLVFALTYGARFDAALAATGHGAAWVETVNVVLQMSGILAAVGALGLLRLYVRARRIDPATVRIDGLHPLGFLRILLPLWARVASVALVLFVLRENYERASIGEPLPALGVLTSADHALTVPVMAAVAAAVAIVAALFRWGRAVLIERIRAALARPHLRQSRARRQPPFEPHVRRGSILGRNLAGRAPPVPVHS